MNVYVDTNLVVARTVTDHPHQADATRLFREIKSHRWKPVISTHGLAEIYSILTRAPFLRPISPSEAGEIIRQNVVSQFHIESLSRADYISIVQDCALNHRQAAASTMQSTFMPREKQNAAVFSR